MTTSMLPFLISLRPYYSNLIFEGIKKAELRRRPLTHMQGREVLIYVTRPVMQLQGGFRAGELLMDTPEEIWKAIAGSAGITKQNFDTYYEGKSVAYALEIKEVWRYVNPPSLRTLRRRFRRFVVPQSWRHIRPEEHRSFRRMRAYSKIRNNL